MPLSPTLNRMILVSFELHSKQLSRHHCCRPALSSLEQSHIQNRPMTLQTFSRRVFLDVEKCNQPC